MFFEVFGLTYHSPITAALLTWRVNCRLARLSRRCCLKGMNAGYVTAEP